MSAKDNFKNEKVEALLKRVEATMQKEGLYLQQAGFMATPEDDEPDGPVFLQAVFLVGEQAFSDRVVDPEQERVDREFAAMMKGFEVDPAAELREKMAKAMREGKDILSLDFEDEDGGEVGTE